MSRLHRICRRAVIGIFVLASALAPMAETKKPKEEREGGVVGTGIIGTITALGSIMVNGQRVTFTNDMMARTPMGAKRAMLLEPGETVVLVATRGQESWDAHEIATFVPLLGPASFDAQGRLTILGAPVDLSPTTQIVDVQDVTEGEWYAVSGLWQGRVLMASRLERIIAPPLSMVSGSYFVAPDGTPRVGGVPLSQQLDLPDGTAVTVRGLDGDATLAVEAFRAGLFETDVSMIMAEGYLSLPDAKGMYTLPGTGVLAVTDNPSMIDPANRGVFCAEAATDKDFGTILPMTSDACDGG